jgi:glucose-6-phosphate 1-dehydrogenase
VTATEVSVKFRRPPYDAFQLDDAIDNTLRFRINPDNKVTLTLAGKKPGAGWQPQQQELTFAEPPGADMRPYDRLIGAALNGERWLFAAEDTVEAAFRVIDPVVSDVVPVHPYARGSWGPAQASALLPAGETWHDPAAS